MGERRHATILPDYKAHLGKGCDEIPAHKTQFLSNGITLERRFENVRTVIRLEKAERMILVFVHLRISVLTQTNDGTYSSGRFVPGPTSLGS